MNASLESNDWIVRFSTR